MRAYSNFEYGGLSDEEMIRVSGTTEISSREGWVGKGKAVAYLEDLRAIGDSLVLCHMLTRGELGFPDRLVGLLNSVTGLELLPEELKRIGERINNLERLFNLREGLKPEDDTLPERFINEPLPDGPAKGRVCPIEPMVKEYYSARDWDHKTGFPYNSKLTELGIDSEA